jgi:hypothetical protein
MVVQSIFVGACGVSPFQTLAPKPAEVANSVLDVLDNNTPLERIVSARRRFLGDKPDSGRSVLCWKQAAQADDF